MNGILKLITFFSQIKFALYDDFSKHISKKKNNISVDQMISISIIFSGLFIQQKFREKSRFNRKSMNTTIFSLIIHIISPFIIIESIVSFESIFIFNSIYFRH